MFNIDDPRNLAYGLLVGLVFGFLLQRGGVTRYRVILGQFLLARHIMLRVMLTAIVVGSAGIWTMHQFWGVELHVKGATLLANILGGLGLGVGMALLGYCPGTGVGAIAEGSRHAIFGVLGMLAGAAMYAEVYPWIKGHILPIWDYKKITFPEATGWSPWVFIAVLFVVSGVLFCLLHNRDTDKSNTVCPPGN